MADTKRGREEQARHEERRQREREIEEARERADEPAPPTEDEAGEGVEGPSCHRRGCDRPASFVVLERYLEDTGHGPVEATATLCVEHTREESPTRLDDAYDDYVFRVEPLGTTEQA